MGQLIGSEANSGPGPRATGVPGTALRPPKAELRKIQGKGVPTLTGLVRWGGAGVGWGGL